MDVSGDWTIAKIQGKWPMFIMTNLRSGSPLSVLGSCTHLLIVTHLLLCARRRKALKFWLLLCLGTVLNNLQAYRALYSVMCSWLWHCGVPQNHDYRLMNLFDKFANRNFHIMTHECLKTQDWNEHTRLKMSGSCTDGIGKLYASLCIYNLKKLTILHCNCN
jgi:hypothetical protein